MGMLIAIAAASNYCVYSNMLQTQLKKDSMPPALANQNLTYLIS